MHFKQIVPALFLFVLGVVCGGYLFSQTVPRSFLAFRSGHYRFYNKQEIAGLVTSAALLRAPFLIPDVVLESDTCLAIRYPKAKERIHFVLFPKHDTKNITTLTPADSPYLLGCYALARELVLREKLKAYRFYTNGPQYQEIAYLHFHLIGE
jgi:hypothetical protein